MVRLFETEAHASTCDRSTRGAGGARELTVDRFCKTAGSEDMRCHLSVRSWLRPDAFRVGAASSGPAAPCTDHRGRGGSGQQCARGARVVLVAGRRCRRVGGSRRQRGRRKCPHLHAPCCCREASLHSSPPARPNPPNPPISACVPFSAAACRPCSFWGAKPTARRSST